MSGFRSVSSTSRSMTSKKVRSEFMQEESMTDNLNKLICDHKMLFEQYATYTREADKLFGKFLLMIEALNQEHERLKKLLECEKENDSVNARNKTRKTELMELIAKEQCLVKEIANVLEQLKRDHLIVSEKEKKMLERRKGLSGFDEAMKERFRQLRYLQELEYKKYQTAVRLNLSLVNNKNIRNEIDNIKATRQKYDVSYKRMLAEIESIKLEKAHLLEEASQCIEDKDTTESMINAILSRNKKEDDLYQQKIENMKQIIRYDTKATDFLVLKLNERSDLKNIETQKRVEELKDTLEAENEALTQQKEALEAIQDATEEKEGIFMVHTYNQKEADKMALFNYIADLNGELVHLKQQHASLLGEIEVLKQDDKTMNKNYNKTMSEYEKTYKKLLEDFKQCDKEEVEINRTMEIIKTFIECTFTELNCSMAEMEKNLGLDLDINPRNMNAYLKEIESEVCKIIHSYHYAKRLLSMNNNEFLSDEMGQVMIKQAMTLYEPPTLPSNDLDLYKNAHVTPGLIPNPVKDFPSINTSGENSNAPEPLSNPVSSVFWGGGGPNNKSIGDMVSIMGHVLDKEELIDLAKSNIQFKLGSKDRWKVNFR